MTASANIARYLPQRAAESPGRPAVIVQRSRTEFQTHTYQELQETSDRYAHGLLRTGLCRGMRSLLLVKPGFEFIALTYGMMKAGIVPVLIDPGMGLRGFVACAAQAEPEGFVGQPLAHGVRLLYRRRLPSVKFPVTIGRRWGWGGASVDEWRDGPATPFALADTAENETAAILFTSGATGPAKGVVYEHGMFNAQVGMIMRQYEIGPADVDMPAFPLFALFSVAFGIPAVIPKMNPSRPAQCDPAMLVAAIAQQGVTISFGSPAIWNRVSAYCVERRQSLPSLRAVLMAGAPVSGAIIERFPAILRPGADVHTPYGATEALPVASLCGTEILKDTWPRTQRGEGVCVGKPLPGVTVKVIRLQDGPIVDVRDMTVLPRGAVGELVVSGPMVTKQYWKLPEKTANAKIRDVDAVWHRMGDAGFFDESGRLWFLGRVAHIVWTGAGPRYPIAGEAIFNRHPKVFRAALVGVGPAGAQEPVMCIEPRVGEYPSSEGMRETFESELLDLADANPVTQGIRRVFFHKAFPVDVRHNAKIDRLALAAWVARQGGV